MEEYICSKGLFPFTQDKLNEFPKELHQYCGKGIGIWQYPNQFGPYLEYILKLNINSYLEIGVAAGGTFTITSELLKNNNELFKSYAIDPAKPGETLRGGHNMFTDNFQKFLDNNDYVKYIQDYSQNLFSHISEQFFDLILIDGDHSYEGVKKDFELFKNHGKYIVLHDIVNHNCPGVIQFWNEIKNNYEYIEFIDQYNMDKSYLGIGIIKL